MATFIMLEIYLGQPIMGGILRNYPLTILELVVFHLYTHIRPHFGAAWGSPTCGPLASNRDATSAMVWDNSNRSGRVYTWIYDKKRMLW